MFHHQNNKQKPENLIYFLSWEAVKVDVLYVHIEAENQTTYLLHLCLSLPQVYYKLYHYWLMYQWEKVNMHP